MNQSTTWRERAAAITSWLAPIMLGVVLLFGGSVYAGSTSSKPGMLPQATSRTMAIGGDVTPEQLPPSKPSVPLLRNSTSTFTGTLSAESVLVLDDKTDTVLYEKNSTEVRALASISKLLTSLVLLDLPINWASTTVITAEDWDGSSHHLNVGEKFTLEDLFHVALIGSSNTAISALERNSGLSKEEFVARLNAKAQSLHLTSVHVVEPTGLNEQNVGTATDTAILLKEALANPRLVKILSQGEYYAQPLGKGKKRRVWSTNWLLTKWIPSDFKTVHIVGKTGFINSSLYNVAVRLEDDQSHVVRVVVLGSASNESRFTEARDIADWVFDNYLWPDQAGYDVLSE